MLRSLLIIWLLFSNLGYGMALLAEVHGGASMDADTHAVHHLSHSADHQDTEDDCDHCCHGLTHLLGLIKTDSIGPTVTQFTIVTPYTVPFTISPPTKLFRPPITA
ncbi:MAG: hypothetical protein ABFS39_10470 [Pseudomonadota bacterium]